MYFWVLFSKKDLTAICADIERCHIRAHCALRDILCLALYLRGRAAWTRAWSTRFAFSGFGTLHFWTTGARAGRTIAFGFLTLATVKDNRALLGN